LCLLAPGGADAFAKQYPFLRVAPGGDAFLVYPSQILPSPSGLYLGSQITTTNRQVLQDLKITYLLSLSCFPAAPRVARDGQEAVLPTTSSFFHAHRHIVNVTNEVRNEFEFDEALGVAYHRSDLTLMSTTRNKDSF
jgi:hypothetical protein